MAPGWAVPCTAVASMVNHSAGRAKPGAVACCFNGQNETVLFGYIPHFLLHLMGDGPNMCQFQRADAQLWQHLFISLKRDKQRV
ncbi:hypothetical protein D3C84_249720 [compost metagenome]